MSYDNVKFGKECREKLIEGVNLCSNAVQVTYGPEGKTSLIFDQSGVLITKDGFHTAMAVNDKDPYVTMGINLVQSTCKKTAKDVGDGTSTAAILTREIVNAYKDSDFTPAMARELSKEAQQILDVIKQNKKEIVTRKDIEDVATISANNDRVIGSLIADAFYKVGKDGIVTFEESQDVKDRVEYTNGFRVDSGYSSPYFINTAKGTCELDDVRVYISETKMDELKKVISIADQAVKDKKSLLLIAPEFNSQITVFLADNQNLLKSCTVISPNYRNFREITLGDMRALLGETSECQKVVITQDTTTFIGCDGNKEEIESRIKNIRNIIAENALPEFDMDFHKKRLANFTSGLATIYVGGYSQAEMKEKYDRIEDAVCATQAALKEGIVPGGGKAFDYVKESGLKISLLPVLMITQKILNTEDKTKEEMLNAGIIEPFLVTKTVLENAVSTASLILTSDVTILNMNNFMN